MRKISRNEFISTAGWAAAACTGIPIQFLSRLTIKNQKNMYGLIGKITAKTGHRDKLIEILLEGAVDMPGCLSYIVSKDSKDDQIIWVTEVWYSNESHKKSLKLPAVQEAIKKGKPLISEFNEQIEINPVGGHGLEPTKK